MSGYIEADALKRALVTNGFCNDIDMMMTLETINNATTIEAEPVRHGKWIYGQEVCWEHMGITPVSVQYRYWECSMCGYRTKNEPIWKYCPNCGARMDKDE